jgi:hypothetical protein
MVDFSQPATLTFIFETIGVIVSISFVLAFIIKKRGEKI